MKKLNYNGKSLKKDINNIKYKNRAFLYLSLILLSCSCTMHYSPIFADSTIVHLVEIICSFTCIGTFSKYLKDNEEKNVSLENINKLMDEIEGKEENAKKNNISIKIVETKCKDADEDSIIIIENEQNTEYIYELSETKKEYEEYVQILMEKDCVTDKMFIDENKKNKTKVKVKI